MTEPRLPVDYANFAHAIMALFIRRQLALRDSIDERCVFVWAVSFGCFQSIVVPLPDRRVDAAVDHYESDGIPITVESEAA